LFFLDVRGYRILELGPLEGHHSVILEKLGILENVAIEGRRDNYEKCLRVKELYGLSVTTFHNENLEDLFEGRRQLPMRGNFDLVFALGVLYHMPDPGAALAWCRAQAPQLFLGTHYVEPAFRRSSLGGTHGLETYVSKGRTYRCRWYQEGGLKDPISGMSLRSCVLYQPDLIRMLHDAGYGRVSVLGKDIQNHNPHITLLAEA